jgi:hypothetical protein
VTTRKTMILSEQITKHNIRTRSLWCTTGNLPIVWTFGASLYLKLAARNMRLKMAKAI